MCTGSHQYRNITFETLMNGCIGCCDADTSILPFYSASITPPVLCPVYPTMKPFYTTLSLPMALCGWWIVAWRLQRIPSHTTWECDAWKIRTIHLTSWLVSDYIFIVISILNTAYFNLIEFTKCIECKYVYSRNN